MERPRGPPPSLRRGGAPRKRGAAERARRSGLGVAQRSGLSPRRCSDPPRRLADPAAVVQIRPLLPDPSFSARGGGFASGGVTPSDSGFTRIWCGPNGESDNDDDGAPRSSERRPVDGLTGLFHGFFCFLFDLPRRASNCLKKGPIYRDLSTETVTMPVSVNRFCPSQLSFL
jgi:hypothetical protein